MEIKILDQEYDAEVKAMLQAFYSRSHTSIFKRIEEIGIDTEAAKRKLNEYYVGYGHDSIAQGGFTTIFIEGVSLLQAFVIEDNALYNGQESSTRYIPFDAKNCVITDRLESTAFSTLSAEEVYGKWIELYKDVFEFTMQQLREEYGNDPAKEKAYKARAFDKARGFLPLGCKTQLSWTTSLRDLNDNLSRIHSFPTNESADVALAIQEEAYKKYPASVKKLKKDFNHEMRYKTAYSRQHLPYVSCSNVDLSNVDMLETLILDPIPRQKFGFIPQELSKCRIKGSGVLDIGSFRDLHRHRRGYIGWPYIARIDVVNPARFKLEGFNSDKDFGMDWYLKGLSQPLIDRFTRLAATLPEIYGPQDFDYLLLYPLCTPATFTFDWGLDQLIYVAELRSQQTIHPTLRTWIINLWKQSNEWDWNIDPHGNKIIDTYIDTSDTELSLKRGEQDIVKKP